ncbi:helix-turn-helix transcriptional regulator [Quisquiliibacterium transsilvanicum]|uniref:DNA-binding CsgD family transcriptional regulator n=1 Tax=Quisquiliibacterium transsilvanicum TaxID=1549638 RepID=A0A7W8HGN6_9BURK|nr:helix-turn-helix transcriptional regulator [Quisquiliibacterium transsilvanicum]MBB5271742.1 DNA-binding CsgD family transcriptional regulator [Quisquiliibacterium transsilvanicum]
MGLTGIELNRGGEDFSDEEVRLLEKLRWPMRALYRQALASACAACATAMLRQLAANDRLGSVRIDRNLGIADASGSALAWLGESARRMPGTDGCALPAGLRHWLRGRMGEAAAMAGAHPQPAVVDVPDGASLALHCVPDPDAQGCTLLIERVAGESPRRRVRPTALTAREAEVLGWITAGKSDAGIAELLGVSPRTVGKHLQNIYRKLGVENRTGAAMRVLGR